MDLRVREEYKERERSELKVEEDGPEDSLRLPEIRIMKRVERKGHRTKSEDSQLGLCFVFITQCIPMGSSVQFSSVAQSCLTLCDPMNPMGRGNVK